MNETLPDEKNISTTLKKAQLHGYERPNFYHKPKATKKLNKQLATTLSTQKVLGDIKVNIQPFSAKSEQINKSNDIMPKNDFSFDSDYYESKIIDIKDLPISDDEQDTENNTNQRINQGNDNLPITQPEKKQEPESPIVKQTSKNPQSPPQWKQQSITKSLLQSQPQSPTQLEISQNTIPQSKAKPSSVPVNNLKQQRQPKDNKVSTTANRTTPQNNKTKKQQIPSPKSHSTTTSSKSAKTGESNTISPGRKIRSKSPLKPTSTNNEMLYSSLPPSPKKNFFLPGESISTRALKNLGFTPEDLEYPSEARINEFTKNNALKPFVRQELYKDVDERRSLFNEEKERLKNEREEEENETKKDTINDDSSFEREQIKQQEEIDEIMQRSFEKQKHEIEFKIFLILTEKYRREEEIRKQKAAEQRREERLQLLHEKHKIVEENNQKRQQFFQQKEIDREMKNNEYKQIEAEKEERFILRKEEEKKEREKKYINFERMKQERLDQHYEYERQKDQERHEKLKYRLKELDERQQRVKQMQIQQQEEIRSKNERKIENHEQLMTTILNDRQRKLDRLKNKLAERDSQLQEKLKDLDFKKQKIIEERRIKDDNCVQRAKMIREEKEREKSKAKQIYKIREQKADEYHQQIENKRIERLARSADIDRQMRERLKQLQDEKDNEIQRRHDEYFKKDLLRTKQIQEKRQEEAAERELEALKEKIDMNRRQFSLLVHQRQKESFNQDRDFEMRTKMQKIKENELRRRDQVQFLVSKKQIADANRRHNVQQAQDELVLAKTENQLRIIAEAYGIDFDSIDALARDPRASRKSVSDFIHGGLNISKSEKNNENLEED